MKGQEKEIETDGEDLGQDHGAVTGIVVALAAVGVVVVVVAVVETDTGSGKDTGICSKGNAN